MKLKDLEWINVKCNKKIVIKYRILNGTLKSILHSVSGFSNVFLIEYKLHTCILIIVAISSSRLHFKVQYECAESVCVGKGHAFTGFCIDLTDCLIANSMSIL